MTATKTLTTYKAKMSNEHFWADFYVNAASQEAAREKLRTLAEEGRLADSAEEE